MRCLAIAGLVLSIFSRVMLADNVLPKMATGRVVDEQGKPIPNVSVGFSRVKRDQPPRRIGEGEASHTLGYAKTDVMGGFRIPFNTSVPTTGPLRMWANHRDYEYVDEQPGFADTDGMSISMKLRPRVALARAVRDEENAEKAVARAVELLRFKPKSRTIPDAQLVELFPYLADIREPLVNIATSGKWEEPIEDKKESAGDRARMLLAHVGDRRDEELLRTWWEQWRSSKQGEYMMQQHAWLGRVAFQPDETRADSIEEAIQKLRAHIGMFERVRHDVECETGERALVRFYYSPIRSWQHCFEAMLVKRNGTWRVLFYRPISTIHINFGF